MSLRHINRCNQLLSSLNYTLTLSNIKFTNKSTKKYIDGSSSNDYKPSYVLISAKQSFLFNRSMYALKNMNGLQVFHKQTRFGFLLFNDKLDKLDNILNFGVLTDFSNNYITLPNKSTCVSTNVYTFLQKRVLMLVLTSVKLLRKILVITTLQHVSGLTNSNN